MTTPITLTLTLAGPAVTASVTWEDVRRYLRAEGFSREVAYEGAEMWRVGPHGSRAVVGGNMREAIKHLAVLADVAPGVMLARIAAPARETEATWLPRPPAFDAPPSTTPSARVPCLDCGRPHKPGHPCPLCDDPDVSIPWRERPEPWIAALASLPDDVAAGMFAAWLAQSRAQTDAARVESDEAGEKMRERAAALVAASDPEDPREDVAATIRALPLGGDR